MMDRAKDAIARCLAVIPIGFMPMWMLRFCLDRRFRMDAPARITLSSKSGHVYAAFNYDPTLRRWIPEPAQSLGVRR